MGKHMQRSRKPLLRGLVALAVCVGLGLWGIPEIRRSEAQALREANWEFGVRETSAQPVGEEPPSGAELPPDAEGESASSWAADDVHPDTQVTEIVNEEGVSYAAQQVLLSFDGSLGKDEISRLLADKGVEVSDLWLVANNLSDNRVLVEVSYRGDADPEDVSQMLADCDFVDNAEPNYILTLCEDDAEEEVLLELPPTPEETPQEPEEAPGDAEPVEDSGEGDESASSLEGEASADDVPEVQDGGSEANSALLEAMANTNDTYFSKQWGLKATGATSAWDTAKSNGSVTVALIDTGVDYDHADLAGNLILGDYAKNTHTGETGAEAVDDKDGHGTRMAGIISAVADNKKGIAGISYNAKVLPINASYYGDDDKVHFRSSDTIAAIRYVISLKEQKSANLRSLCVISMSLGSYSYSSSYQEAINDAYEAGLLVVASAGNDATSRTHYPSAYSHVMAVSATEESSDGYGKFHDSTSNFGPDIDIAAPGYKIYSTSLKNKYQNCSGTSPAAAMASGAAALVFSTYSGISPDEVEALLESSAIDKGDPGRDDYYGHGVLRLDRAVASKDLSRATIATIPNQTYVPGGACPVPQVTFDGAALVQGTDYTVTYADNEAVGTATLTITGANGYIGKQTATYRIVAANLSSVTVDELGEYTYTGSQIKPKPTLTLGSYSLVEGKDYTVSYRNNVNTGTATVVVTGKGNFTGQRELNFTIVGISIFDASMHYYTYTKPKTYTGQPQTYISKILHDDDVLVEGKDYVLEYRDNVNAGEARVYVTGMGVYSGTGFYNFTIDPASIIEATVADIAKQTRTGSAVEPRPQVTWNGMTLAEDVDYSLSYDNNVYAGTATLTITGINNFTDTTMLSFRIGPADGEGQDMYRLYNPNSGEHFYTASAQERDDVVRAGWMFEGIGWVAPVEGEPVYRLYNAVGGEHHYTTDAAERDMLVAAGWNDEGISWYSDTHKAVALLREYNPNAFSCNHNYTTSQQEHADLVSLGWVDEGVGWYGLDEGR